MSPPERPGQVNGRVAGYLAQVLDADGQAVASGFQVAPGVMVTAWHALDEFGAGDLGAEVRLSPLAGGAPFGATVVRVAPAFDLAVLTSEAALALSAPGLVASDTVALQTPVVVQGLPTVDDPEHDVTLLTSTGSVQGPVTRDGIGLVGTTAVAVTPGMSGAPVRRLADDLVIGVVSGRYNSIDGWLENFVWVARSEDLAPLLHGVGEVTMAGHPVPTGAAELVLAITASQVRLSGEGIDVSAPVPGVSLGLSWAVDEVRRRRAGLGAARNDGEDGAEPVQVALGQAGQLLGECFLVGVVADELAGTLRRAADNHVPVRIGIEAAGALAQLPWEALPDPVNGRPLALHPLVNVYRRVAAPPVRVVPGPLRILVAIAAPDDADGAVLDYEQELRNVLAAVRSARQGDAHVRVVEFASTAAIRTALDAETFHVLHLSGHGRPGELVVENDDGAPRPVDADTFVAEAIPAGSMPPMVTLSACYTDVALADSPSFAARLIELGVSVVVATETSVSDAYATRVLARVYGAVANAAVPDVVGAVADARRAVQRELDTATLARDRRLVVLDEWATVTVLAGSGSVPLFDPALTADVTPLRRSGLSIGGLVNRESGDFVGRRREQRRWPAELVGPSWTGLVLCGIGGVGKTTLAVELAARVTEREPHRLVVGLTGELSVDDLLGGVVNAVRRRLLVAGTTSGPLWQALEVAGRVDLAWADRLAVLRAGVFDAVPLLVVLDNFEDNLAADGTSWGLRDPVLGSILAEWVSAPGAGRLLITSRYAFALPGGLDRRLSFRHLGPLTLGETLKLVWALPALDRLDDTQVEQVWRMVGGHPRALEYLDAVLSGGTARFADISERITGALTAKLNATQVEDWYASNVGLDAAVARVVTLAADDVLLDDLLARIREVPGAERMLVGVSVYREPADANAVLFQLGEADESARWAPDRQTLTERIQQVLVRAGRTLEDLGDFEALPEPLRQALLPLVAEMQREPRPPLRTDLELDLLVDACRDTTLLTVEATEAGRTTFVHRWTATELADRWQGSGRGDELAAAHRAAADYWRWRVDMWPQDPHADVHDLVEARHHLLAAGEVDEAGRVTETICSQLHTWGAWDHESALIHDTLARLPESSDRRAAWIQQVGIVAQLRGDHEEAERRYRQSLEIKERIGNQAGMASSYHQLGRVAQARGNYEEAERRYRQSLEINERIGNQAGMASGYHQLGTLAQDRGDYEEAERRIRQSLEIKKRIDAEAGMATSYGQLGTLAQERGDYEEAERRYRQSLDIDDRLGNQAGMARSYHNFGIVAQHLGDYEEAERRYRQSLEIEERIGNQAGMASSYHQLGRVAQHRGDLEEAERRYRQSLEIKERIGTRAGMATSQSQLGILAGERGRTDEAVGWHLSALSIRLGLGVPHVAVDLQYLAGHRSALGRNQFHALVASFTDDEQADTLDSLLDQYEAGHQ